MKKHTFLIYLTVIFVALGICTAGVSAKTVELRYGLWAKPGEAQYDAAMKFKEILEKESGGTIKVIVYPGNQLGTPREMLAQLALDTTQICASGDPGIKEVEYLALPFLMNSIKNYSAILNSPIGDKWNDILINKRKVRFLGFLPRSPRQISTNKVVNTMDDMKGLKLRVPERDYYVKSITAFGSKPTPMAFKEVYTALQTGIVDGQENPIETIYAQKFYEVQKCVVMISYIDKPAYVMIGEKFWSARSEKEREWIKKAQAASEEVVMQILPKQQEELIEKMKKSGIVFTYPDKKLFIEATQSVRDELGTKRWGKELYQEIVKIGKQKM